MSDPEPASAGPDPAPAHPAPPDGGHADALSADPPPGDGPSEDSPQGPPSAPPESTAPTAKRLGDFFVALEKAIRADRMYRSQGEIVARLNAELLRRAQAVARDEPVTARVASVGILYDGQPVTPADERTAYLFQLYCDGVRELTFLPGLTEPEVRSLVTVFKADIRDSDEDLVTLLWRQGLEHIRYYAVDSYAGGGGGEEADLATRRAKAQLDRDGSGDVELALSSGDLRVLRTVDLLDWVREAAAPASPDASEQALAEKVRDAWDRAASPRRFLAVALRAVAHANQSEGADGLVLGVFDAMLAASDAEGVGACLEAVAPTAATAPAAIGALRDRMLDASRIPRLAALLDRSPDPLLAPLMALEPVARPALVGLLTSIPSGATEERLQQALGAAGVDLTPYYARRIQSDDTQEVLGAIAALGRIGSDAAMNALGVSLSSTLTAVRRAALEAMQGRYDPTRRVQLSRCLKDPDSDNRLLALNIIASSGDPRMCWAIMSLAEDASFQRMPPDEQRAIYRAMGTFKDDRTLTHFRKLLAEKNLTRSKPVAARQEMVVEALALMGTESAQQLAREFQGKWHLPRTVNDALARALSTWGAGS